MANPYFQFKQFTIHHDRCAMKVTTDSCFFGAWIASEIEKEGQRVENVLDIGSGTGLLPLMVAQKNAVEIDAVEIDREAAEQATENVSTSPWEKRIHVVNEDILFFRSKQPYDCIISNPPFYENELASEVQKKNIAHHSQQLVISQVVELIKMHLKSDGLFFLMLPFKRKEEIERLIQQNELYLIDSVILSQSVKHSPFRIVIKGSNKKPARQNLASISVWDEKQQYTTPFIDLLKGYYLYL